MCGRVPSLLQWQGNLCSAYITTLSIYSSGNSPAVAGRGVGKNMGEVGGGGGGSGMRTGRRGREGEGEGGRVSGGIDALS